MWKINIADLLKLVNGVKLSGDGEPIIEGFASLKEARRGDLSFFNDARYEMHLRDTKASAVLVPQDWKSFPENVVCIGVEQPSKAFETITETFGIQPAAFVPGVHPSAVVSPSAKFDPTKVSIGANAVIDDDAVLADGVDVGPCCYVGKSVHLGRDSRLMANVTVQTGCSIGERVILHPAVVVGGDGFGYEFDKGRHRKVRQSGIVQIDNDVEVGAGSTIDRARFGRTWIGEGTKIDNLVQIGHNVVIGKHCIIVACTAIAGSAVVEDYVVIAAQSGIAGHVTVGAQSTLGARSGVTKDLPARQSYLGFPAAPAKEERRRIAAVHRLPQLMERIKQLEARLDALASGAGGTDA